MEPDDSAAPSPPPPPPPPPPPSGGPPPRARSGHSLSPSGAGDGRVYLFGGLLPDGTAANDLWMYSAPRHLWHQVHGNLEAGSPPPRMGHTAAYVDVGAGAVHGGGQGGGGQLVVFGGYNASAFEFNDLWAFSFAEERWHRLSAPTTTDSRVPCSRGGHTMFAAGEVVYVQGGYFHGHLKNDVWTYNLTSGAWTELKADTRLTSAAARWGAAGAALLLALALPALAL